MKFNRLIALMLQMAFNFMQPQTPMQPQKPQQQPQPQQQTVQANGGSVPSQENKRKGVKYEATELGANSKRNRAEIAVNLRRTTRDKVVAKRRMNAKGEMVEMMRQPTSLFDEKKRDNNPEWKFPSKIPDRAMLMSAVINVPKLEEYAQLAAKRTDPSWTKEEREARAALITIARVYNNPHMDIKTLTITTKSLRKLYDFVFGQVYAKMTQLFYLHRSSHGAGPSPDKRVRRKRFSAKAAGILHGR